MKRIAIARVELRGFGMRYLTFRPRINVSIGRDHEELEYLEKGPRIPVRSETNRAESRPGGIGPRARGISKAACKSGIPLFNADRGTREERERASNSFQQSNWKAGPPAYLKSFRSFRPLETIRANPRRYTDERPNVNWQQNRHREFAS